MMVSTKGRYALRVMIDLAEHHTGEYIPLKEVASRQEISEKYLESIISVLVKAGFLQGLRGKGGGYRLTRSPEQYTAGAILRLTEGSLAPVACLENGAAPCSRLSECRTLPMWKNLDHLVNDYLESITLADLAQGSDARDEYVI
ncbi:MAG TPA: Rrf2 family transcriptional regulator [Candidatus Limiplasma sp.]|jgi:Rrf2 family iron-sulfur cluster assembly transcriptional regulator|nr:Rrf2 family transcriptional regulator [Candidatus Limiplasma sp.]